MSELVSNVDEATFKHKVSQSELYNLLRCKKQYQYAYVEGLTPASTPDYLTKGSFLHSMMEGFLSEKMDNPDAIPVMYDFDVESRMLQAQQIKEGSPSIDEPTRIELVTHLKAFWKEVDQSTFTVVAVEPEIYADMGWEVGGVTCPFHGFIDGVVRDTNSGDLWIVEHKTAGRAWSAQQFEFAYQGRLYADAWERLTGERPVGIQYNFFYPKRFEIRQQYVSVEESASLNQEVYDALKMREALRAYNVYPREPMWGCNGCQFRDLCYTELIGADGSHIRETQFTVNTEKRDRFVDGD